MKEFELTEEFDEKNENIKIFMIVIIFLNSEDCHEEILRTQKECPKGKSRHYEIIWEMIQIFEVSNQDQNLYFYLFSSRD